ncbi:MAG: dTDP-4-dehydrorhamnose reductase [Desulfobacterales bacterium]
MRILVIGCNGQVGRELCRLGKEAAFHIRPLDLPEFDITDKKAVDAAVKQENPFLVINAAAYTAVDMAESDPDTAFAVNRDGPAHLASSCAEAGIPLIHISTDYVFDGSRKRPYVEDDPISPIGVYGRSKAEGDSEVRGRLDRHVIIRTSWLCSVHGKNFVKTILRLAIEQESIRVVSDQVGCPTFAPDLAEAILNIAGQVRRKKEIPWGTYHYCGRGETTWYDFARQIVEFARDDQRIKTRSIKPIGTKDYPTPAKRPAYSVLDCSLIEKHFGIQPKPWKESLGETVKSLLFGHFSG